MLNSLLVKFERIGLVVDSKMGDKTKQKTLRTQKTTPLLQKLTQKSL